MLPKRLPKRGQPPASGQQLQLENTVSTQSRLKKKRKLLLFAFAFTVGLSILFSFYRLATGTITHLNFSLPSINLPQVNVSKPTKISLDKEIRSLLPQSDSWSIYTKTLTPPSLSWSLNTPSPDVDAIIDQLSSHSASSSGLIQHILPQGVLSRENLDSNQDGSFKYQTLISVPGQQILILINGPDQKLIPQLVQVIYWQVIKSS